MTHVPPLELSIARINNQIVENYQVHFGAMEHLFDK